MRIHLVRHAEAAPGEPDELRVLTAAGRAAATALGRRLAGDGVRLDAVLTSPLLRARETGVLLATPFGVEPEAHERLAPGATPDDLRAAVRGRGEAVVVVGHQPDCGLIAAALTGVPPPAFPPAGCVLLELP